MDSRQLKLLYDGECPFCRREVDWLKARDRKGNLILEDIAAVGFDPGRYGLTREEVQSALHGILPDGRILRGMDAVRAAYRAVGRGWLLAPTALPGLRQAADLGYRVFARYRLPLGRFFGRECEGGVCRPRR